MSQQQLGGGELGFSLQLVTVTAAVDTRCPGGVTVDGRCPVCGLEADDGTVGRHRAPTVAQGSLL